MSIGVDQVSDAREQLTLILSFFPRVDVKLSAVLAFDTAVLATLSASAPLLRQLTMFEVLTASCTCVLLFCSFYNVYRGGFPNTKGGHSSLIYFREIATRTEARYIQEYVNQTHEPLRADLLSQVWRNSEILADKYRHLKMSFVFMVLALLPWTMTLSMYSAAKQGLRGGAAMSDLQDALKAEVEATVTSAWKSRAGEVVPRSTDLALGNDRVVMNAVILYGDLADSTELAVMNQEKAAEVFKSYLRGCTRLIRANNGEVRSFDGDRVMGVFIGDSKNTNAAKCGLQINWFFHHIVIPHFQDFYGAETFGSFAFKQTVVVDVSSVQIVPGGIRSNNDLVWVGRAPNVAAKLSSIRNDDFPLSSRKLSITCLTSLPVMGRVVLTCGLA